MTRGPGPLLDTLKRYIGLILVEKIFKGKPLLPDFKTHKVDRISSLSASYVPQDLGKLRRQNLDAVMFQNSVPSNASHLRTELGVR